MRKGPDIRPAVLRQHAFWLLIMAVVAALPVARELFSADLVLSEKSTDITLHFLFSRAFGFGEMAAGNLPLWNPYIYSGIPYLGQFQSALLYPPNLIFLLLPLATAINWSFGLHVFLLGATTYAWAAHRSLRPAAAFVAGVAAMFSGTFFLHIYAGHLSNVCAMAWVPLILLGIDGWLSRRHAAWLFLSSGAAALQIYAGHPQYVYYTALVAGAYALVHLVGASRPLAAAGGLFIIYPLAALLGAAQLLPGISAASESVRSGGVTYEFASMFAFPPENILTLFTPWFFGDMGAAPYWGRCYLWEMSLYAGVGVIFLACHGACKREERAVTVRLLVLIGLVILLALGARTPLHHVLYLVLPGFSGFRGASKFIFFAGLFIALIAGMGMDRLLRNEKPGRWLCFSGLAAGLLLLAAGLVLSQQSLGASVFPQLMSAAASSKESYLNPAVFENAQLLQAMQSLAVRSLQIAGGTFLLFAGLFFATWRWPSARWMIGLAAVAELFFFARSSVTNFPLEDFTYKPVAEYLKQNPGDYRTLNLFNADASMLLRSENIWGYDPSVLKRYAQLLHLTQGNDPEKASQYLQFQKLHPILSMLRCRLAFVPKPNGSIDIVPFSEPFPRFFLASNYKILPAGQAVLDALKSPDFDLRTTVVLESEPIPKPESAAAKAEIRILNSSTDHWTLEILTDRAALLVNTDSYSKDWRAVSLPGSVQITYQILPANHAMRAIPLAAGRHRLKLEYVPEGLNAGIVLSFTTLALLFGVFSIKFFRKRLLFAQRQEARASVNIGRNLQRQKPLADRD